MQTGKLDEPIIFSSAHADNEAAVSSMTDLQGIQQMSPNKDPSDKNRPTQFHQPPALPTISLTWTTSLN